MENNFFHLNQDMDVDYTGLINKCYTILIFDMA